MDENQNNQLQMVKYVQCHVVISLERWNNLQTKIANGVAWLIPQPSKEQKDNTRINAHYACVTQGLALQPLVMGFFCYT